VVGRRELRWTPDARVARGGVLAEGRERIVDGRVDSALERMYRALARTHA
jgi:flagellar biosynthesis/type III secretory pathway protein FliH